MIQRLQKRFILISMSSLLLVLILIIGSMNVVNYYTMIKDADEILSILLSNKGVFPKGDKMGGPHHGLSPEAPYENRFFSVLINEEAGSVIYTDTSHISSINSKSAIELTETIMKKEKEKGFIHKFRYVKQKEDGVIIFIYLDCGRKLEMVQDVLFASLGISLIGYILVFLLVVIFSNRIVRPISESYEKQKRFITDAGHELKTPLTIIHADVDVLEMEIGENEWLQDIQKQTKRLTALTEELVLLARMEENDMSNQIIEFPLSDVVTETVCSFQGVAQAQKKEWNLKIQPMLTMRGNEKAIRQLITILLDNALKYSKDNSTISVSLEQKNKMLRLQVFNVTENFIAKESLPLLFERFYRTDSSHNSGTGGHGIGLSVARAIVNAYKGKIQAYSEDGYSLNIIVLLPI